MNSITMVRIAHFVFITKRSGLFLFFDIKRQGDFAMDKYIIVFISIAAVLTGIAIFYLKDKSEILKRVATIGAGIFAIFFNIASLNQVYTIASDVFDFDQSVLSCIIFFVIIAATTAGALKVAFDKAMEEIEKEYPDKKDKDKKQ